MLGSNLADNLVAMGFIIDTGILQQWRNQVELAIAPIALAVGDVLVQNKTEYVSAGTGCNSASKSDATGYGIRKCWQLTT